MSCTNLGNNLWFCKGPGCYGGSVWGSGPYTYDSNKCAAGRHSGLLPATGGIISYKEIGRVESYTGTTQNGVTSQSYGGYNAMTLHPWDPSVKPSSCFGGEGSCYCIGPGCTRKGGSLWGSNPYTSDASRCQAARHAGVIGDNGGFFLVEDAGQVASYSGSTNNGITSTSYGSYKGVFIKPADGSAPVASPASPAPVVVEQKAPEPPPGGSKFSVNQKVFFFPNLVFISVLFFFLLFVSLSFFFVLTPFFFAFFLIRNKTITFRFLFFSSFIYLIRLKLNMVF